MSIRLLNNKEEIPYNLLLLADETIEAIDKYISNSDIYVFESNNQIIAVYALLVLNDETIEIKNIAVSKKHQGKGIGKLLLDDCIKKAIEKKCSLLTIGTGDASFKQLNLYQKFGFEIFDIKHNFFVDNYPEAIFENGIQLKDMIMLRLVL